MITNEIEIRGKVQSELIWAKVISKIDAKVFNGETRVYERTTGTTYRRLSNSAHNTSPPSLVSFAQATTSTPQQLEQLAEQQDDEQSQEADLQEVQQAQLVLQKMRRRLLFWGQFYLDGVVMKKRCWSEVILSFASPLRRKNVVVSFYKS